MGRGRRRIGLLLVLVAVAASVTTVLVDAAWRVESRRPRVVLMGAGDQLSVWVAAGDARLLLASGDDPAAFGNALAQVRRATAPRLDVLLVAGEGRRLLAPAALVNESGARLVAAVGPLGSSPEAEAVGATTLPMLSGSRRFRLPDGLSVVIEVDQVEGAGEEAPDDGSGVAWRMVVRRGSSTVVVLSDGDASTRFPTMDGASVLVVAGRTPLRAWASVPAAAFVVAGEAVEGREVRKAALEGDPGPRWSVRVHPAEVATLTFRAEGVELPEGMAQSLATTVVPDPAGG